MKFIKRLITILALSFFAYFTFNAIRIYNYSKQYSEEKSDVAIVLGAAINDGVPSPVFRERINHSIYLYKKGVVGKIIYTGGLGKGQNQSESEVAKSYAISRGVKKDDIFIEEKSKFTVENLSEAKKIMDVNKLTSALLVTDPFHMKRGMMYAKNNNIQSKPSPTKTSMYKSKTPKFMQLMYESFFFSLSEPMGLIDN
jgi:uncharacterized SAM-binding protein YcdF (DUF218 family)